jgi:hypothetical protein
MMKQRNLYYLFSSDNTADTSYLHAHCCAIYMSDTNMVPTVTNGKRKNGIDEVTRNWELSVPLWVSDD